MDVESCNVYQQKKAGQGANKMYVNEEVNVSEMYPEIYNIVKERTNVQIDKILPKSEQVQISGYINYGLLYYTNDSELVYGFEGEIPFEENLRIGGTDEKSIVDVKMHIESLNIKLLNPRKIMIRAEIGIEANSHNIECIQFPESIDEENDVEVLKEKIEYLSLKADRTDNYRIKETITIPNAKPAADRIVWHALKIKNINTKAINKQVHISGEISVFVMYLPEESEMPNQWIETNIDFNGSLDVEEADENLISYIDVFMQDGKIHLNENEDGENRDLTIDIILDLKMKFYEEKESQVIKDVYSPYARVKYNCEKIHYNKLLIKNASRTKSVIKIKLDQTKGNVMQICNAIANLDIKCVDIEDNCLVAKGKIKAEVMYISSDDKRPVCVGEETIDFKHQIDADGITREDDYYLNWRVEQVSASMVNSTEIEVKAVVALEAIVFDDCEYNAIDNVEVEDYDEETLNDVPEITGYVVKENENLWKIAKNNYTTIKEIQNLNKLENTNIKQGDRLLIMKSCKCR